MSKYSFKREKVETNFLRPRLVRGEGEAGMNLKALITVDGENKGRLCWGIVDDKDNFVAVNQQMKYDPWTGAALPRTVADLKAKLGRA